MIFTFLLPLVAGPVVAQDDVPPDPVVEEPAPIEEHIPEPTAEPSPTPSPTPTPEPTPTPTAVPTEIPTLEPTAVPTIEPTVIPTDVPVGEPTPSPVPTETPTPAAAPSPTPTPAGQSRAIAPAMVVPGGNVAECTQTPTSDLIQPGQTITANCVFTRSLLSSASLSIAIPESTQTGGATGWVAQLRVAGGSPQTAPATVSAPATLFDLTIPFTVTLQAPANAVAGTTVSTTVTASSGGSVFGSRGNVVLSATVAPLGTDDMSMSCSPASPLSVPRGQSRSFTCTIYALSGLSQSSLVIRSVTIPPAPSGWGVTTSPGGTVGPNGAITISPSLPLRSGQTWSITVLLSPACTGTTSASWGITTQVANTNGTITSTDVSGPSVTYNAAATGTPASVVNVAIVNSNLRWSFLASLDDQVANGQFTYRVTATGCSGWSTTVRASPFTYTGSYPGAHIPANNVALTSSGAPTVFSGNGTGVASTGVTGELGTARKVMMAEPNRGNGIYEQSLGVSVTVPGGTTIGSYRSTITITTAAAP